MSRGVLMAARGNDSAGGEDEGSSYAHRATEQSARSSADATRGGPLQVLAFASEDDPTILMRECVDCGLRTGRFCDYCRAEDRFPAGDATRRGWAPGQRTPLCSFCDNSRDGCHFCLGILVTRPVHIYRGMSAEELIAASSGAKDASEQEPRSVREERAAAQAQ